MLHKMNAMIILVNGLNVPEGTFSCVVDDILNCLYLSHITIIKCYKNARCIFVYQLPLILTALLHVDLTNVAYLTASVFIRS